MADKESILQLGIEAARAGDKEEARKFFRLLTRETPQDSQAWLWLAGVAEDREEKRAALEMVTQLDPSNQMAQKSLAALGGARAAAPVAPAPVQPDNPSLDDFDVDWDQTQTTAAMPATSRSFDDDVSFMNQPDEPVRAAEPARTRELSPEEEFAMSLDSFSTVSTAMNDRSKTSAGGKNEFADFDIPDFGEDLDLDAYMNRERVDMSTIEVSAEQAKAPVRKPITKGGISDEAKARLKEKKPRPVGAARASGGWLPLLLGLLVAIGIIFILYRYINRDTGEVAVNNTTAPTSQSNVGTTNTGGITSTSTLPIVIGGNDQPTPVDPNNPNPSGETPPPQPTSNVPVDPNLGSVQPQIVPSNGFNPLVVDQWFFNYGGFSSIADGNVLGVQPQGRWVAVQLLMNNATDAGTARTIPADLIVLKDDQGRVYRPNLDASEAYFNQNQGAFNFNLKQEVPFNQNVTIPFLFDVAPDATNLVLFSPLDTNNGYFVRANAN